MTEAVRGDWLYARDIEFALCVSRQTACRLIKRIPGAERLYRFEGRVGERWRVSVQAYARWRASEQVA